MLELKPVSAYHDRRTERPAYGRTAATARLESSCETAHPGNAAFWAQPGPAY